MPGKRTASDVPDEHTIKTDDGWTLFLYRYAGDQPVLFVHGMGANRYNFDLNPRHSLARAAAAAGWDSWVMELRGRGKTSCDTGTRLDWNFEDFLHRDLRRAVAHVREVTGRPLHWVGHSMGGMLGVAYVECYGDADLRSLTLFGTPLAFERNQWMLKLWGLLAQIHRFVPTMDQEKWGRRMLPLMKQNPESMKFFLRYLANPDNVDAATSQEIFQKLVTNEAPGIVLQFSDWVRSGQVRSADHGFNYTGALGRVKTPAAFICGVNDLMAPAEHTTRQMAWLASTLKRQVVLSKENGFTEDYGHGDLLIGKKAPEEVYPAVFHWLREVEALPANPS